MAGARGWFGWFLRLDILLGVLVFAAPFIVLMLVGILWLFQNNWLIPWLASLVIAVVLLWIRHIILGRARRNQKRRDTPPLENVEENHEWTGHEREIYRATCGDIETKTKEPVPWPEMQDRAMDVVKGVANRFSDNSNDVLNFTVPEALLLTERAASRYRKVIRDNIPLSDSVSVGTLYWIWEHGDEINRGFSILDKVRRVVRAIADPHVAAIREIEGWISSDHWNYVGVQFQSELQRRLLQEIASAAVDLYSGRLKYSDAELLKKRLNETLEDLKRTAALLDPLRILVVGQTSAGKSSIVDVLTTGRVPPEIDAPPTTEGLATYEMTIDDFQCHLVDTPGFDTTGKKHDDLMSELTQCDLVIWTLRANRPARNPDHELLKRFNTWFAKHKRRRKPPVLAVATGVDLLPFPSEWPSDNRISGDHKTTIEKAIHAIADETGMEKPIPVCARKPDWNIDAVRSGIESRLRDAVQTQLNRRRLRKTGIWDYVIDPVRRMKKVFIS